MHLLQVCNVGNICGGTAACAWTVARALPGAQHTLLFLSPVTPATRDACSGLRIESLERVDPDWVSTINPDIVLLHNTSRARSGRLSAPLTVQYLHSRIDPAPADLTVICSNWLRQEYGGQDQGTVLWQPVAVPEADPLQTTRLLRDGLLVGRLCTPTTRKWPWALIAFYAALATEHPHIHWEFVGCPDELHPELLRACAGRAAFLPASWLARRHLHRWDVLLYHHPTLAESFGRTVAEALMAGCIPVVDDRGGFREQIEPAVGYLCRGQGDFSAALTALQDRSLRHRLSRRGQLFAHEQFSTAVFVRRFRKLLESALSAP
jgi:glycosyltransferase involved in cell wall biosynthesis